ncbi:glycosyltransferase [Desulfobacula phenolica]|uniref:Sugar transferase, PEP-CTERM/EpsH1 system associated n=1 Tax=Desulfobacula phenolica TaxID=90732 RepID=A0A1H2EPD9_9BACT|nr:glycosyltransferase [Desulfobacula phenolica]SDT97032.1 sugar transferase, PEP-CTERM/EpsH1 system associated [Desulfobacula phenolica]
MKKSDPGLIIQKHRPIKILHILDSFNIGGLENGVVNLVNTMDQDRFHHTICCIRDMGPMHKRILRKDVEIISLNVKKRDWFVFLKLAKIIAKIRPDVVHTRNYGTIDGIIGALLAHAGAVIHGEHGREFNDPEGLNKRRNFFRKLLFLKPISIVAVSNDICKWLNETVKVPAVKICTIINGVDTNKFLPPPDKAAAKIKIGVDPSPMVIGSVGRMDKVKNYEMLLTASSMIDSASSPFCMVFVGDGPERKCLEQCARDKHLKNVVFAGQQENVVDYLQAFDLFVLPSVAEGISNTILEAMACGLHVIATDVGGNTELIEDKKNGTLVHLNDVEALADRIGWSLANPEASRRIGEFALKLCIQRFSLERMVLEYENLYTEAFKSIN